MRRNAFTLIELLISVSIVAILTGSTLVLLKNVRDHHWQTESHRMIQYEANRLHRVLAKDIAGATNVVIDENTLAVESNGNATEYFLNDEKVLRRSEQGEDTLATHVADLAIERAGESGVELVCSFSYHNGQRSLTAERTFVASSRVGGLR